MNPTTTQEITHGRVGHGSAVHAFRDGALICGSGRSSYAHSFRNPRRIPTTEPITCKKCLALLETSPTTTTDTTQATVTEYQLADLTSMIVVDTGTRRYYWHLGRLWYTRAEDAHLHRQDVIGHGVRMEIKQIIDSRMSYNVAMADTNEQANQLIREAFYLDMDR